MKLKFVFLLALYVCGASVGTAAERLFYMSQGQVRQGAVYKPKGDGPFPAVIFAQNSGKPMSDTEGLNPFPNLGRFWTEKGYVLFVPGRHVSLFTPGEEEGDAAQKDVGPELIESANQYAQELTTAMLTLKAQSYVDPNRIVLSGTIGGATATLLIGEQNMDVRAYVVFSPGASYWKRSPVLQRTLKNTIERIDAPVFLLQPRNDYHLGPSEVLGQILDRKGNLSKSKIFPPFGKRPNDARPFAMAGTDIWGRDVIAFLDRVLK